MVAILLGLFILFSIINILYYLSFFSFANAKPSERIHQNVPVSVIICAKNEEDNLRNFLPSIISQDYPDFEIIVINDASTDNTLQVIEEFQKSDLRIKLVNVQNIEAFWANKKYALTLGIKKATNKHLLFTDADCAPQSKNWIREMSQNFQQDVSIILGYGGYFQNSSSVLNKLIRFETLLTAIQYFSYAKLGSPYMGVGRNLAYTSTKFYEMKGFASHLHIKSGDDDLFVNEAATAENTDICFENDSITRSVPKDTFAQWFRQKRRHVSVAGNYKRSHQFLLGMFYISRLSFWIFFAILISLQFQPMVILFILCLKLIIEGIIYYKSANKLNETDVVWFYPFFDLFLILLHLVIFITNLISKPKHWK